MKLLKLRLNKKQKIKGTGDMGVEIFYLPSHLPHNALLMPQASWQSQVLRLFWKARNVGINLASRIFQKAGITEKRLFS